MLDEASADATGCTDCRHLKPTKSSTLLASKALTKACFSGDFAFNSSSFLPAPQKLPGVPAVSAGIIFLRQAAVDARIAASPPGRGEAAARHAESPEAH